ncbi:MAG TPA: hypothetical protein VLR71_03325 [Casimicrobiaceae bacterium]|nr:hypothetical protein [Casimicrobiaceae bacterium]
MRRLLSAGAWLLVAGCASGPANPDAPLEVNGQNIAPYASVEECRTLAPGDRLDYRFTSTSPVAFNIHYRESNAVIMPIVREGVVADSGIFQPIVAQRFCVAWEAGAVPVAVSYRIAVRRRAP